MKVSFIGAGRVARAFSAYLKQHSISTGVYDKNHIYSNYDKRAPNIQNLDKIFQSSDIVFITTPDDIIGEVAKLLADSGVDIDGDIIVHMSGSRSSGVLRPIAPKCGGTFSLHPMMSILGQPIDFSKVFFTLEGGGEQEDMMLDMLWRSDIHYSRISGNDKALYHAASCFSANYTVVLLDIARQIYSDMGFNDQQIRELVIPMMRQVLDNVEQNGSQSALTGPISRGDTGTVQKHLESLKPYDLYTKIYRVMGGATADIALKSGRITPQKTQELKGILQDD